MSEHEIGEALDFAVSLLPEAGALALANFRIPIDVQDKRSHGVFDPVTEADRGIETLLRERIRARYPDHGIVGEEHGTLAGSSRLSWIIDPIDGTRAFISGMPAWGILIGVRIDGSPAAGLMHQPFLEETFAGVRGRGGWYERRGVRSQLAARQYTRLAQATLYTTHPGMFTSAAECEAHARVAERVRLSRFGGDCYSFCLLALGHVDLVIEGGLQPYDIQPLIPVIEAAGGVVGRADGSDPSAGGFVIASANRALHDEVLALLASS